MSNTKWVILAAAIAFLFLSSRRSSRRARDYGFGARAHDVPVSLLAPENSPSPLSVAISPLPPAPPNDQPLQQPRTLRFF